MIGNLNVGSTGIGGVSVTSSNTASPTQLLPVTPTWVKNSVLITNASDDPCYFSFGGSVWTYLPGNTTLALEKVGTTAALVAVKVTNNVTVHVAYS